MGFERFSSYWTRLSSIFSMIIQQETAGYRHGHPRRFWFCGSVRDYTRVARAFPADVEFSARALGRATSSGERLKLAAMQVMSAALPATQSSAKSLPRNLQICAPRHRPVTA